MIALIILAVLCFGGSMVINLTPDLKRKYGNVALVLLLMGWVFFFLLVALKP